MKRSFPENEAMTILSARISGEVSNRDSKTKELLHTMLLVITFKLCWPVGKNVLQSPVATVEGERSVTVWNGTGTYVADCVARNKGNVVIG